MMCPPARSDDGRRGVLAVVADGMGGHQGGEVASELAIETVCRAYYQPAAVGSPGELLALALAQANRVIFERAAENEQLRGMGTTCTALVLHGGWGYVAHVGDSRLYLIRDAEIYQITEDHSMVMELVRNGILGPEEARTHPERNLLQRALGRRFDVEISGWDHPIPLQIGDRFVLCSDGLCAVVSDESMRDVVLANDPAEACRLLIELARRRNAPDNVTAGVVRLAAAGLPEGSLAATREIGIAQKGPSRFKTSID